MLGWFFDILVLLSVTVTVLKFALNGTITAEQAGLILVAAALLVAIARIAKISICRLLPYCVTSRFSGNLCKVIW